ncbi:LINE-1 reverse transcriptase [Folsomia candida]|uniref:LINE-1 reverse transcriptase n=1 Tax=Folsomia candida TaxID=158441 RepID=A0A226CY43_FOLCA|nr:LINE-1 reverse transcriptase [Folsomia candida]
MINKTSLLCLGTFFAKSTTIAFTPILWNQEKLRLELLSYHNKKEEIILAVIWWFNNAVLGTKVLFLVYHLYFYLIPEDNLPLIVFQVMFFMINICAMFHNIFLWVWREDVVKLFNECCIFNEASADEDETFMDPEEPADDDVSIPDTSLGKSFAKAVGSHGVDFLANSAHGVVLRRIKEVPLVEVLKAFSKYVSPQFITHADNLGAANWAVWLKDSESFDKVMRADSLSFGAASVKLYAYANPIRRVIVRGVPPFVNDADLSACFSKFGELRGYISHQGLMNAGEEFAHIKSFTRIIELAIPKGVRVPDVVTVKANGKEYKLRGDVDPPVLRKITDTNNDNEVMDSIPPFKRPKTLDFQDVSAEEVYESDNSQRSSSKSRRNRGRPKSRTNSDPKPQTMSEWGFDLWNETNLNPIRHGIFNIQNYTPFFNDCTTLGSVNVHFPFLKTESDEFLVKIKSEITAAPNCDGIFVLGDWNFVVDTERDRIDSYRHLCPQGKDVTFVSRMNDSIEGAIRGDGVCSDFPDRKVVTTRVGITVDEALDGLSSGEKLKMVGSFFAEKFAPSTVNLSNLDNFMSDMPKIPNPGIYESDLSCNEILQAIQKSPNNKAPGLDGLTFEFYKKFSGQFSKILSNLATFSCAEGFLPKSCKSSVATLIYKAGDPKNLKNYRTISLTNTDYKIISSCVKSRLNIALPSIIGPWQTCGVRGSLDQEAAYDRVNLEYLYRVLKNFGYPDNFIKYVKLLHTDFTLVVSVGSDLTAPISVGVGLKQGDPSASPLYCIAIEPLLFNLHKKLRLSGPSAWRRHPNKYISAYADDTNVLLGHQSQIGIVESEYEKYSQFSSSKLNDQKSVILILGAQAPPTNRFPVVSDGLKILGIFFGNNNYMAQNFTILMDKFDSNPIFWYIFKVLDPPMGILDAISKKIENYVWWGSKRWVSRPYVYLPLLNGGLGVRNPTAQIATFRLTLVNKVLSSLKVGDLYGPNKLKCIEALPAAVKRHAFSERKKYIDAVAMVTDSIDVRWEELDDVLSSHPQWFRLVTTAVSNPEKDNVFKFWHNVEKLETAVRSTTYPEMIEKITAAIKEGSSVVLIMPISVFLLSLNDATMPPFFGSVLPPAWTEFAPFRIFLSIVEMYISGFAWVANVQLFHLIICQAFFIAFWIGELKLGREKDTQLSHFAPTFRGLQYLNNFYNECYSIQVTNMLLFSFPNQ